MITVRHIKIDFNIVENYSTQDKHWMQHALQCAVQAEAENEVPVGAVLVLDNTLISDSYNQLLKTHDPAGHAEIIALKRGGRILNNYRLLDTTLYVTLEPCVMCFGALIHARVKRVVYAAADPKAGCLGGMINLFDTAHFNHRFQFSGGLLGNEASQLLKQFFKKRRS